MLPSFSKLRMNRRKRWLQSLTLTVVPHTYVCSTCRDVANGATSEHTAQRALMACVLKAMVAS
eukprot:6605451-Pyramimonas_sp.AAC.1